MQQGYLGISATTGQHGVPVLTLIGFSVIEVGIIRQRPEQSVSSKLRSLLPPPVTDLIEQRGFDVDTESRNQVTRY